MSYSILLLTDIAYLERILLGADGALRPVPFEATRAVPQNDVSLFCHRHGIYQIITTELVEFVRSQITGFRAIEIGAGNGCLGRAVGIPVTDSKIQETTELKRYYAQINQPPVRCGADVEKFAALRAIKVKGAEAAVGCWVTHKFKPHLQSGFYAGVDEAVLSKRIRRYVFVGNRRTHADKELLRFSKPKEYCFGWLVSRSLNRDENMIWVFDF